VAKAVYAGVFGVHLFFTLSSFLITSLLLREIDTHGDVHVRAFWIRRILRIWPLYFGFLFAAAAIQGLPWRYLLAFSVFFGNYFFVLPGPWPMHTVVAHLWSVSVEEQFYLAWALLLWAVPGRRLTAVCWAMIALAVAVRTGLWLMSGSYNAIWCSTFTNLEPIAIGALIALWWRAHPPTLSRIGGWCLGGAGVVSLVVVMRYIGADEPVIAAHSVAGLLVALACGAILIAALSRSFPFLAGRTLVYLGQISYGLYVFHYAAGSVVRGILPHFGLGETFWLAPLTWSLTLPAAVVSYHIVEKPFLRLKERFTYVASGASSQPATATALAPPVTRAADHGVWRA